MDQKELERLIKGGLQVPVPGVQPTVTILMEGEPREVHAEVGTYMAINQLRMDLLAAVNQLTMMLDGVHHHLAKQPHPKSQRARPCPICVAINDAYKKAEEQQDANVVAGGVGAGASVQGAEESQEQVEGDS